MSKTYVIQWKSRVNGRAGKGTKLFTLEEGESLVWELNQEYPNIHHELVDSEVGGGTDLEPSGERNEGRSTVPAQGENDDASYATHAFSE